MSNLEEIHGKDNFGTIARWEIERITDRKKEPRRRCHCAEVRRNWRGWWWAAGGGSAQQQVSDNEHSIPLLKRGWRVSLRWSKKGEVNFVFALPSIRFSWNFSKIISGTKDEYKTSFKPITCHSWQDNGKKRPFFQHSKVVEKGPKGTKMVKLSVFDHWEPFWAHLDPFGPFQTRIDILLRSTSANPYFVHLGQKNHFCLKWSKRVQMGPKGSQMVKNT